MRIVHLVDYFQPRLGYQEIYLARAQKRNGHDVRVVTSDRYCPFPNYEQTVKPILGERICGTGTREEEGVTVVRLPGGLEFRRRCFMRRVAPTLRELRPDVVHVHGIGKPHAIQAARLRNELRYHLLIDDHSHIAATDYGPAGEVFRFCYRSIYSSWLQRNTDTFVAISEETKEIMRDGYGIAPSRIHVIPLGVDTDEFAPNASMREAMRTRLGFTPDDFVVIYTGKVVASKGPHLILEAIAHCPSRVKALVIGNIGDTYWEVFDQAKGPVKDRVLLRPAVPHAELADYYLCADVGCWPLEDSMAMLEAAASGLPIIVHAQGLADRICNDNGLEYKEGDVLDLAEKIRILESQPTLAQEMGARSRELVLRDFSWSRINERFEELYAR